MRIFELTREAVAQPKPLPILPQGAQTPPPAAAPSAAPAVATDKPAAPAAGGLAPGEKQLNTVKPAAPAVTPGGNVKRGAVPTAAAATPAVPAAGNSASLRANINAATNVKPGTTAPAPAAGDVAAFGGGVVNPPSKSGVVSKADLEDYRLKSGNPTATLGQYMNQQQGKTFRKGGANDPAVIAARRQPVGPAVGSQAQTASGQNELAKQNIAGLATSQVAQPAAAPTVVSRNDGVPPPEPVVTAQQLGSQEFPNTAAPPLPAEPAAAPNPDSGSGYTGSVGNVADFGVRGTPILPYGQGSPVAGTTNVVTRTDAERGDTNPRTGVVTPGSYDANKAQGQKNLDSVKNFLGLNKPAAAPAAAPAAGNAAALRPPANPLRGQFAESTETQDPVLVRMQNLAGIRR